MASTGLEGGFRNEFAGTSVGLQRRRLHGRLVHVFSTDGTRHQYELHRRKRVLLLSDVLPALRRQSHLRLHAAPARSPSFAARIDSTASLVWPYRYLIVAPTVLVGRPQHNLRTASSTRALSSDRIRLAK